MLSIQNWITNLHTLKDRASFILAFPEKAHKTIYMWDSSPSLLSILCFIFFRWILVSKLVWQMFDMELDATIGMITFQACWSFVEWQPLTYYHPFERLCTVFCTFSKSFKFSKTSCQIGFLKIFWKNICWYSTPLLQVTLNHSIVNLFALLVVNLSRLMLRFSKTRSIATLGKLCSPFGITFCLTFCTTFCKTYFWCALDLFCLSFFGTLLVVSFNNHAWIPSPSCAWYPLYGPCLTLHKFIINWCQKAT